MSKEMYKNTGRLARLTLRLDRIRIPIWLLSISAITWITADAFTGLYQSAEERQAIAETMVNPAMTAMLGPGYGLDNYTNGAMMAHQMLLMTAVVVGIMCILLVTRHTRADEEDGRIEMIRSLPSGRLSNLNATVLVLIGTNVLLALIIGIGLYSLNIESMDLEGSLLYGAALGATGIFFTAVTAVFAQLSENSRGTIGLSFAVLGIAYLIRAMGDVGNEALSWLSPLGWIVSSEVYVNNYWWPVILTLVVALILIILAFYLNAIRDLDSGFLPSKPGKRHASSLLQSPLGLMLRLQRTGIIAWAVGMVLLGVSYGSVLGDLESFFESNDMIGDMLPPVEGLSLTEQFLTMLMKIMSLISTIPALMAVLKLMGEEKKNRTEHLLARAVSRTRLMCSFLLIAVVSAFVMLSLAAISLWSAGTAVMEDGVAFSTVYSAAMVYLPAMWMMISLAVLLIGIAPRFTGLIWLYLLYSFIVVYMGPLLQFPTWMSNLSPYGHIPQLPVDDMSFMKVSVLIMIAIIILLCGFITYNKRDLQV